MTLKAKLFSTIAAFCLVAVLMIVGVFAASSVKVNMNGQISFTANDVNATIDGAVTGISGAGHTFTQIVFDGSDDETGEPFVPTTETWSNLDWSFANKSTDIVFTITINNTSTDSRAFTSKFDATSILAVAEENVVEVTIKEKLGEGKFADLETEGTEVAAGETLVYQITFAISDSYNTNNSISAKTWQNASITLTNVA